MDATFPAPEVRPEFRRSFIQARFATLNLSYLCGIYMSRHYSHLNSAKEAIGTYDGSEPFANHLRKFFAGNKKFGSRDRKSIAHLCYCYFRTGGMGSGADIAEKILTGLFLTSAVAEPLIAAEMSSLSGKEVLPIDEKLALMPAAWSLADLFPAAGRISETIDRTHFSRSHLLQPDLFLRIRPSFGPGVGRKLIAAGIPFQQINEHTLALPNATKLDEVIELNREAVIQDYSSQRIREFFPFPESQNKFRIWDCCAASGGKSILLHDVYPDAGLFASDIRESIILNLRNRFRQAGIERFHSEVIDLTVPVHRSYHERFDLVAADVPCSGSGTWGRTPEHLTFFKTEKIADYVTLQRSILSNITTSIKQGGYLLYITCSVYREENEAAAAFARDELGLELVKMESLIGYDRKADTMFAALMKKQ